MSGANLTRRVSSFDLSGRTAVVTGASRGLGSFMSKALARAGASLVISARDARDCADTIEQVHALGGTARAYSLDVRSESSVRAFGEAVTQDVGAVDILVNNAGCNVRKPFLDTTWDDWNTVLETNLRGGFFVTQAFAPGMTERGYGRVINIGSVTSVFGFGAIVPYVASRGGVLQMSRALADTLGPHGITVNCLAPGWFRTAQTEVLFQDAEWRDYIIDRIPLKRLGTPTDLDGAVVFLASEESSYVTGQILLVDGGMTTGAARAANPKP